jgi:hypothetical protein
MEGTHPKQLQSAYLSLLVQSGVAGVIMYLVMFAMIDSTDSFFNNINIVLMTLMMVVPMILLMIVATKHMFLSAVANRALIAMSLVLFFGSFALIRTQAVVGDRAFLRSMIPHHSGAILMCREAKLSDPEIIRLCTSIQQSQRREIEQMKAILARK